MALNQVVQGGALGGHRQVQGAQPQGPLANLGLQMAHNANPGQGLNLGHAPPVWLRGAPAHNPLHGLQPVPVNFPHLPAPPGGLPQLPLPPGGLPQLPLPPGGLPPPPHVQGGNVQQGGGIGPQLGPQPGANANQAQAPQPTGHVIPASKNAIKALQKHGKADASHGVSDPSRLLDWATLEGEKGRKMRGKTATAIREGLEAFKQGAQAQVSGSPNRRAQDVAALKGHLDTTLALLDTHIGDHTKGEAAMVSLKNQLTTYKALLDQIGTDGPAPGTKPTYMDMLKTRAFGMPDSALAQIATHGRQGVQDLGHLGSGAVNSTKLVQYPGEPAPMVFKPMHAVSTGTSGMEQTAGIDLNNPRFANRNVATTVAASHLGLSHMVPRTQFAAVGDQIGIAMEKLGGFSLPGFDSQLIPLSDANKRRAELQEGYLADGKYGTGNAKFTPEMFAKNMDHWEIGLNPDNTYGARVREAHKLNTTDPKFLEQVNDAEWLHALTGEMDPNSGNMRAEVRTAPNGTVTQHLKLFDFDFSFGANVHDPTATKSGNNRNTLPPLVSARTVSAFADIARNWAQKKQEYAEHLSPAELSAMETRLFGGPYTDSNGTPQQAKGIIPHIRDLIADSRVVQDFGTWRGDDPPGSGNRVDAATLMRTDAAANNGYLDRIEAFAQDGRDKRAAVGL